MNTIEDKNPFLHNVRSETRLKSNLILNYCRWKMPADSLAGWKTVSLVWKKCRNAIKGMKKNRGAAVAYASFLLIIMRRQSSSGNA